jgi:hypothetical protein
MTILLKNGAVFLHIPKTGGCWITHALQSLDLEQARLGHEHADVDRAFWHDRFYKDGKVFRCLLRRAFGINRGIHRMKADSFKFCFVREPLTWYESYWRFMESMGWPQWGDALNPYRWHPDALLKGTGSHDFNTFVANVNKRRPGFVTEMYGWYARPSVNFVGKQENLSADLIRVLAMMKVKVDVAKVRSIEALNETPAHIPKPVWDAKLKRETLRLEYAGYVRFGYPVDEALMPFRSPAPSLEAA